MPWSDRLKEWQQRRAVERQNRTLDRNFEASLGDYEVVVMITDASTTGYDWDQREQILGIAFKHLTATYGYSVITKTGQSYEDLIPRMYLVFNHEGKFPSEGATARLQERLRRAGFTEASINVSWRHTEALASRLTTKQYW